MQPCMYVRTSSVDYFTSCNEGILLKLVSSVVPHTIHGPSTPFHIILCTTTYSWISFSSPVSSAIISCPSGPTPVILARLCRDCILTTACRIAEALAGSSIPRWETTRAERVYLWRVQRMHSVAGRAAMRARKDSLRPSAQMVLRVAVSPLGQQMLSEWVRDHES